MSVAVPEIVTLLPSVRMLARPSASVIVEVGAVVSVDAVVATQPGQQRRRLHAHVGEQVDRRLLHVRVGLAVGPLSSRRSSSSRPQAHCTVPAPNTSAPLGARYRVRLWVAVPRPATCCRSR